MLTTSSNSTLSVDGIDFSFPENWHISKYDDWAFYDTLKKKVANVKAVDLFAIAPDSTKTLYMIEVKDYRMHQRTKTIDLAGEVQLKVHSTLAALLPASLNATDSNESAMASRCLKTKKIRVILHLEQPAKHSKLFPRSIDPANVLMQMKIILKPVDAHPCVVEKNNMSNLAWSVE